MAPLCPLGMPVTVLSAARICQRGPKRGSEATERGAGCGRGVPPPTVGRFFVVENSCMKTAFSCSLNAIIRG